MAEQNHTSSDARWSDQPPNASPAIFDGRKLTITSAINLYRSRDRAWLLREQVMNIVSREDAPFVAVLYGEDLGESLSLMVDLRTGEVVWRDPNDSDELVLRWREVIAQAYFAEMRFDDEMNRRWEEEKQERERL